MPKVNLYLDLAKTISQYATCLKLKVGCVLVNDSRILSMGYNGAPRGEDHCKDIGCDIVNVDGKDSCKRAIHAEANALLNAAYVGASTKGATLYCTHTPCFECAKLLLNAGVKEIIASDEYDDPRTTKLWVRMIGGWAYRLCPRKDVFTGFIIAMCLFLSGCFGASVRVGAFASNQEVLDLKVALPVTVEVDYANVYYLGVGLHWLERPPYIGLIYWGER